MHKLFKRIAVLLTAAVATVCVVAFSAACEDKEEEVVYATDTFVVTVLDENGNPLNGQTAGENGGPVRVQFCSIKSDGTEGSCTGVNPELGTDGKATIQLSVVKAVAEASNTNIVEVHVLNADGYLKDGEYGQYEVDKIPTEITVTLKKA